MQHSKPESEFGPPNLISLLITFTPYQYAFKNNKMKALLENYAFIS